MSDGVRAYIFGNYRLDTRDRELTRDGQPVPLTPKALAILLALVERHGHIVEKADLMQRVWPDTAVEEANLTQNIFVLRKALGEAIGEQKYIATVARRGYRFVADTTEVTDSERGGELASPSTNAGGRASTAGWRLALAGAGLAVAMAVAVVWLSGQASTARPIRAIAVLPLTDLAADADREYFAEGMTDAITTDLTAIGSLRVASHQSVKKYRKSQKPIQEIARDLGVDAIVQGSILRSGTRLRLNIQLVHAETDRLMWGASYDRNLDDVVLLQGELAGAVAKAMSATIVEGEGALGARRTVNPEAYDAYLRGRHFWGLRSEDALRKSIEYYRQALQHDPMFAPAYAGMAQAYVPFAYFGFAPPGDAFPAMRAAAEKALELDPALVDAHVALAAEMAGYRWDWPGALSAWKRVLDRHPNHAVARHWHGLSLEILGRFDEALAERLRAIELDPLSLQFNTSVAGLLHRMGRRDEAIARFHRTLELEPDFTGAHLGLGQALLMSGRTGEAMAELRRAVSLSNDALSHAILGYACGVTGDTAAARQILGELKRRAHQRYLPAVYLAYVHIGLGDVDSAFARLEDSFQDHSPMLAPVKVDPIFDSLRTDPRFTDLLRRMNLSTP